MKNRPADHWGDLVRIKGFIMGVTELGPQFSYLRHIRFHPINKKILQNDQGFKKINKN